MKRKRRSRNLSIDAQIRAQAKQIYATGMVEAMRVATLGIVAQKLDEIRILLQAAGVGSNARVVGMGQAVQPPAPAPTGPVCVQCGRPGVRRTRPNKFNRQGSWYCASHAVLAAKTESEDAIDNAILGPQAGTQQKKSAVAPSAPAEIKAPIETAEPAGEGNLESAMSALGV